MCDLSFADIVADVQVDRQSNTGHSAWHTAQDDARAIGHELVISISMYHILDDVPAN